jgi:hypothetical protein
MDLLVEKGHPVPPGELPQVIQNIDDPVVGHVTLRTFG